MKVLLFDAHLPSVPLRGTAGPIGAHAPEVNCPISRSNGRFQRDRPGDISSGGGWWRNREQ